MGSALMTAYVEARTDTSKLPGDLARAKSMVSSWASDVSRMTSALLAGNAIRGLVGDIIGMGKAMVTANAQMENYIISLSVLLKSEDEARAMMAKVEKMAAVTPFTTQTLTNAITQLKVFGFANKDLLPIMQVIGNAAAASPRGMEDGVQRLSYAMGQMKATGKLMSRELRQMALAGVPVWQILSEQSGKSVEVMRANVKAGAITADQGIAMLLKGMEGRFGGMMEKQSQTWTGLMSTLSDNSKIFARKVGAPFFELAKMNLKSLTFGMDTPAGAAFVEMLSQKVAALAKWLGSAQKAVVAFVTDNWKFIKGIAAAAATAITLTVAMSKVRTGISIAAGLLRSLVTLNPFALFVELATAGAFAFVTWNKEITEFVGKSELLSGIARDAQRAWEQLPEVWERIKATAGQFWDWLQKVVEDNRAQWEQWGPLVVDIFKNVKDGAVQAGAAIAKMIDPATVGAGVDGVIASIAKMTTTVLDQLSILTADPRTTWEWLKLNAQIAFMYVVDRATWLKDEVVNIFEAMTAALAPIIDSIGTMFKDVMSEVVSAMMQMAMILPGALAKMATGGTVKGTHNLMRKAAMGLLPGGSTVWGKILPPEQKESPEEIAKAQKDALDAVLKPWKAVGKNAKQSLKTNTEDAARRAKQAYADTRKPKEFYESTESKNLHVQRDDLHDDMEEKRDQKRKARNPNKTGKQKFFESDQNQSLSGDGGVFGVFTANEKLIEKFNETKRLVKLAAHKAYMDSGGNVGFASRQGDRKKDFEDMMQERRDKWAGAHRNGKAIADAAAAVDAAGGKKKLAGVESFGVSDFYKQLQVKIGKSQVEDAQIEMAKNIAEMKNKGVKIQGPVVMLPRAA